MNNAQVLVESEEQPADVTVYYRNQEARVSNILRAIEELKRSQAWKTLQELVFENLTNVLQRELTDEAKRDHIDSDKLHRIAGQLMWAEKYSNLDKMEFRYRNELVGIKEKLHGNTSS